MRHLPKHLQPRWRYLAVCLEAWPDAGIERRPLQGAIWESARALLGDTGSADADLAVLRFAFETGTGEAIVRTRRETVEPARAALACVHEIEGDPVSLLVVGTSGTIRACEENYLRGSPQATAERTVAFEGAERTAVGRGPRVDVAGDDGFTGATDLDFHQG